MKRSRIVVGLLLAGWAFSTACTKDLKNDVKDLQQRMAELRKKNDTLKAQAKAAGHVLGTDEPIKVTTTFEDDNNVTRTITDTYSLKAGNSSTQYMLKQADGTYEVYIERFGDVDWDEGAYVYFIYHPTTRAITDITGGHYYDEYTPYIGDIRYQHDWGDGLTLAVTLNSIDINTGDISLQFAANGNGAYTQRIYDMYNWYVPNAGKPVSTQFTFAGKLKVFTTE